MRFRRLLTTMFIASAFTRAAGAQSSALGAAPEDRRSKVGASTLLGVPMYAVERPLRDARRTFQWDVVLSPWVSVDGYPLEFAVGTAEWRWYRNDARDGWYTAVDGGLGVFRLRRPDYRDTTLYQEGGSVLLGASVGRVFALKGGWSIDAYAGFGTIQSLYKGYDKLTGSRYDGARLWNVSGEWLPYRTGLTVGLPWRRRNAR